MFGHLDLSAGTLPDAVSQLYDVTGVPAPFRSTNHCAPSFDELFATLGQKEGVIHEVRAFHGVSHE